jgi:hypothetical protein
MSDLYYLLIVAVLYVGTHWLAVGVSRLSAPAEERAQ